MGDSVALGEHEVHWRTFLNDLNCRGLGGVELLVVSDGHLGLKAARKTVLGGLPWQHCQVCLQQNTQAYVHCQLPSSEVAADIRSIFNAPNRTAAETLLAQAVVKYTPIAPRLANWLEVNIPEGLTVLSWTSRPRHLLRTIKGVERLNREIRQRTRVAVLFPNEAACLC